MNGVFTRMLPKARPHSYFFLNIPSESGPASPLLVRVAWLGYIEMDESAYDLVVAEPVEKHDVDGSRRHRVRDVI